MPTIFTVGPYRFIIYMDEGNEPPHVHVRRDQDDAKFWLEPTVVLSYNRKYPPHELHRIEAIVIANRVRLREKYRELHHR